MAYLEDTNALRAHLETELDSLYDYGEQDSHAGSARMVFETKQAAIDCVTQRLVLNTKDEFRFWLFGNKFIVDVLERNDE
jgi:hypothetical protein